MTLEELNIVRKLNQQIADEEKKLQGFKDLAQSMTPPFSRETYIDERNKLQSYTCLNALPKGSSIDSRVEMVATLIVDTEKVIEGLKKRIKTERTLLVQKIQNEVSDTVAQTLLIHRYVLCEHFRDIGFVMRYSESYVYFTHRKILETLLSENIIIHNNP